MNLARALHARAVVAAIVPALAGGVVARAADQPPPVPAPVDTASKPDAYVAPSATAYRAFAESAETMLHRDVIDVWFPRAIDDEHGGFRSDFARDWSATLPHDGKFSVFQARLTWLSAELAVQRPDLKDRFLPIARHGLAYLNDVLWDRQNGGFFWGLDEQGKVSTEYTDGKHLYGNSFGLYALAAAYQASNDPAVLAFAKRAFRWLDDHGHDAKNGGYYEWLTRDGKSAVARAESGKIDMVPVAGFPIGYKSMNTHIHLLESFTQLYEVWKDPTLRKRIEELIAIIRDKICVAPGAMNLYLSDSWVALPGHDSYGHDVEAAYLMLEAEEVLGHGHAPRTLTMARMLVDHALAYGWDAARGGFYRDGGTYGPPEDKQKEWWVQAEGLNALLLMHDLYGATTDAYFRAFQKQWQFINDFQRDAEFHGLYEMIDAEGRPVAGGKGRIWKEGYHEGRALLNVTARLQKLAQTAAH